MSAEQIYIAHQIHRLDRSITKLLEKGVKAEGLDEVTLMHGWILRYLYEHQESEIYQKDIEKYFGICRSAVTNIIQVLEKRGLVCRTFVESDARLKKVTLTEEGIKSHNKLGEIFLNLDGKLVDGISQEELQAFMKVVDKVYQNIEKQKGENL